MWYAFQTLNHFCPAADDGQPFLQGGILMAKRSISITLEEELLEQLRIIAHKEVRSVSGQVRIILRQWLEGHSNTPDSRASVQKA